MLSGWCKSVNFRQIRQLWREKEPGLAKLVELDQIGRESARVTVASHLHQPSLLLYYSQAQS